MGINIFLIFQIIYLLCVVGIRSNDPFVVRRDSQKKMKAFKKSPMPTTQFEGGKER